jgi:hypothetical protein
MPQYVRAICSLVFALALPCCGPPADVEACYVQPATFSQAGAAAPTQMFVAGDQQWCSVQFHSAVPSVPAYQSGAITENPTHGQTRLSSGPNGVVFWYRALPRFVGSDEFSVEYGPGGGKQTVLVTVRASQDGRGTTAMRGPTSPPAGQSASLSLDNSIPPTDTSQLSPVRSPIGFRCLPSGAMQVTSSGGSILWLGTDPSSPDICIGRNSAGSPVQRVRGIWNIGGYWPDTIPAIRQAMARLTIETPGTPIPFTVTGKVATPDDPRAGTWTHTVQVTGEENVTVPAGTFRAIVIDDSQQGVGGNTYRGSQRIWIDPSSGALLRWVTTGSSDGKTSIWETTSLRLP